MSIIIDIHEDQIYALKLKAVGIPVEVKHLPIGDMWIGNLIIEHKKIDDFFASVTDGRYYKQLYNMLINCTPENKVKSCVYITGTMPSYIPQVRGNGGRLVPINLDKALRTHKTVSMYSYGIPVFQVANDDEFIKEMISFYERSGKNSPSLKPNDIHRKKNTIPEIKSDIFCAMPQIGRKTANYLSKHYSIVEIANMDITKLSNITIDKIKIGKRSITIKEALNK